MLRNMWLYSCKRLELVVLEILILSYGMGVAVSATLQRKITTSLQRPKGVLQLMLPLFVW